MGEWKALKREAGSGWRELEREAGTGWKALEWESVAIDVGADCINRTNSFSGNYTVLSIDNPANAAGIITNVCIWLANHSGEDSSYVGTFYLISGTTYKCRDAENVGILYAGENNKTVSLNVEIGDLIGIFCGNMFDLLEKDTAGFSGVYYNMLNKCIVDNETSYTLTPDYAISLYGSG